MKHALAAIVVLTSLAACAAPPPSKTSTTKPGTVGTTGNGKAVELPTKVGLTLPSSVGIVAQGGGNIVAQGGGNYGLLAASVVENVVAAAVKVNVVPYLITTVNIEKILLGLNLGYKAGLIEVGVPFTFRDDDNPNLTAAEKDAPENKLTALLEVLDDHARVSIFQGPDATPAKQIGGLTFTSKTKGTAVFKPQRPDKDNGKGMLATTFDLDASKASADGYFDKRELVKPAGRERYHWEFDATPGAKANALFFKMRVSAYLNNPAKDTQLIEASANFTNDGGGAAILGVIPAAAKDALGDKLVWFPNDGTLPDPAKPKPHDIYLDPKGLALDNTKAPAAYKALVPDDSDVYKPYVKDPAEADPTADPVFAFPR